MNDRIQLEKAVKAMEWKRHFLVLCIVIGLFILISYILEKTTGSTTAASIAVIFMLFIGYTLNNAQAQKSRARGALITALEVMEHLQKELKEAEDNYEFLESDTARQLSEDTERNEALDGTKKYILNLQEEINSTEQRYRKCRKELEDLK